MLPSSDFMALLLLSKNVINKIWYKTIVLPVILHRYETWSLTVRREQFLCWRKVTQRQHLVKVQSTHSLWTSKFFDNIYSQNFSITLTCSIPHTLLVEFISVCDQHIIVTIVNSVNHGAVNTSQAFAHYRTLPNRQ
jgi:hypothetical protein